MGVAPRNKNRKVRPAPPQSDFDGLGWPTILCSLANAHLLCPSPLLPPPDSPHLQEHQKAWALNLNGFDVEEAKILRLSGKPQNAPEGETWACWVGLLESHPWQGGGDGLSWLSSWTLVIHLLLLVVPGYQNRLKVLYSQKNTPGSSRKTCRYIPSLPDRILDAPEIRNDYCKHSPQAQRG